MLTRSKLTSNIANMLNLQQWNIKQTIHAPHSSSLHIIIWTQISVEKRYYNNNKIDFILWIENKKRYAQIKQRKRNKTISFSSWNQVLKTQTQKNKHNLMRSKKCKRNQHKINNENTISSHWTSKLSMLFLLLSF